MPGQARETLSVDETEEPTAPLLSAARAISYRLAVASCPASWHLAPRRDRAAVSNIVVPLRPRPYRVPGRLNRRGCGLRCSGRASDVPGGHRRHGGAAMLDRRAAAHGGAATRRTPLRPQDRKGRRASKHVSPAAAACSTAPMHEPGRAGAFRDIAARHGCAAQLDTGDACPARGSGLQEGLRVALMARQERLSPASVQSRAQHRSAPQRPSSAQTVLPSVLTATPPAAGEIALIAYMPRVTVRSDALRRRPGRLLAGLCAQATAMRRGPPLVWLSIAPGSLLVAVGVGVRKRSSGASASTPSLRVQSGRRSPPPQCRKRRSKISAPRIPTGSQMHISRILRTAVKELTRLAAAQERTHTRNVLA